MLSGCHPNVNPPFPYVGTESFVLGCSPSGPVRRVPDDPPGSSGNGECVLPQRVRTDLETKITATSEPSSQFGTRLRCELVATVTKSALCRRQRRTAFNSQRQHAADIASTI